ncbi:MAG: DUF2283 domain-containing protein [Candidatus Contendobacter sp.]|nr:DUF2283 domain-containing protein [Candidatus Contendobacter sp.]
MFDPQADTTHLERSDAEVEQPREMQPGVVMDYDVEGRIVRIQVLCERKKPNITEIGSISH